MSIADELITRGWGQGRLMDSQGRVCLLGAAACAAGVELHSHRVTAAYALIPADHYRAIAQSIEGYEDLDYEGKIVAFNDSEDTTRDDVLRVAKIADEILGAS